MPPPACSLTPARVTNAMWDYSWLYQHYEGGAFADWDRCLDELVERGFGAVRIDAFPLIIGKLAHLDDEVTFASAPHDTWGPRDRPRRHCVPQSLLAFVRKAAARGLQVILSSWDQNCVEWPDLRAAYAPDPLLLADAWTKTLRLLGDHDLLRHVLYVDIDQEFPYFSPFRPELDRLGKIAVGPGNGNEMEAAGRRETGPALVWNPAQSAFIRQMLETTIGSLQERFPELKFTISLVALLPEIRALHLSCLDVLELHFWMHSPAFDRRLGFQAQRKDRTNQDGHAYQKRIDATLLSSGAALEKQMRNQLAYGRAWADELGIPLTTTEAWGPWWHMDGPGFRWEWLKEWCAYGHGTLAREYGLWSSTPWNFAHPYWENWSDIAWYQQTNAAYLAASS